MNLSFASPLVIPAAAMASALILLKLTCLLLTAVLVSALMRRRSAGARHVVWLVAVVATLLLPLWSAWSPLPVRVLPAVAAPVIVPTRVAETGTDRNAAVHERLSTSSDVVATHVSRPIGALTVLLAIWASGVVALLIRLALGGWGVRNIVRGAGVLEQADWQRPLYEIADRLGLDEAPQLLQSHRIQMPFATGFLKPVIVLPAASTEWSHERRCAVLIHELAHVKRRDLVAHLAGGVACALYWFHPLVWKAATRLRAEGERACDDLALVLGAPAHDYAEHLLEIVAKAREEQLPPVALAMAKPREFEGRILAILDPRHDRRAPRRAQTAGLVGGLTVLALVVGAVSPARRVTAAPPARAADHVNAPVVLKDAGPDTVDATSTQASERIRVLANSLRSDSDAEVRRVAAWGLSRYARHAVAAEALADAVLSEKNPDVREMATWALSGSRTPAAMTALEYALRDGDPRVRRTAVWATGRVGSRASVERLIGHLSDADASVREVTAWAIGSCSPPLAPAALVRGLGDTERDVRLATVWALCAIADPRTSDDIEAAFPRENDPEVRRGLVRALCAMGERSIPTLTRLVDSSDPEIRAAAVGAVAGRKVIKVWPWLRPQLRPSP